MNTVDQVIKDGNDLLLNYITAYAAIAAVGLTLLVGRVAFKFFSTHLQRQNVQSTFCWKNEKENLKIGVACIATLGAVGLSILGFGISVGRANLSKN